jgi:hypothetical protein
VADELIELFEGIGIEEEVDAFAGGEFAFGVLAGLALGPAAGEGSGLAAAEFGDSGVGFTIC